MQQKKRSGKLALSLGSLAMLIMAFHGLAKSGKPETKPATVQSDSASATSAMKAYAAACLDKSGLSFAIFEKAYRGYTQLKTKGSLRKDLIAIADMSVPSNQKRLFIVDLASGKLLIHTYVAHGRNSGERMATQFSNKPSSLQSSLGFFVTGDTYQGNNGYSMRLVGMEKSINDKALERAIVMHGAPYVNEQVAKQTGRIGRSWGCPAVSMKEHRQIIDLLKNGSCLFIYAPQQNYLASSDLINNMMVN